MKIKATAGQCNYLTFGGTTTIAVNSRVAVPSPVSGPSMCFSGQTYQFTTSPSLASRYPFGSDCYYHYGYLWTAPVGWSINGGINTAFTNETISVSAPVGTPAGSYNISVQGSIPYGGPPFQNNSWFSTPKNFSIQIGPFSASQVTVAGTSMVCNGNSYTYTADVPTGHQNGYSYSWTYPSGWTVENIATNTIRLYVPSYNSSFGPVRVSVNNGCGTTPLSGMTVFPCSYMMSSGDFKIYPNPSFGELYVEYEIEEKPLNQESFDGEFLTRENKPINNVFRVEVFDRTEKLVKTGESKDNKVYLDTKGLQPGAYFLHIYSGKDVLREQILIK
ncbi:T9SS type A sorting domain-containing protein [Algoriphagus sp.]|uniref:T9SS type A sorting domain-containing protein n=1 Tax=Algoriphagus sp. TaxID=1872435 RepID=UPI0032974085